MCNYLLYREGGGGGPVDGKSKVSSESLFESIFYLIDNYATHTVYYVIKLQI